MNKQLVIRHLKNNTESIVEASVIDLSERLSSVIAKTTEEEKKLKIRLAKFNDKTLQLSFYNNGKLLASLDDVLVKYRMQTDNSYASSEPFTTQKIKDLVQENTEIRALINKTKATKRAEINKLITAVVMSDSKLPIELEEKIEALLG